MTKTRGRDTVAMKSSMQGLTTGTGGEGSSMVKGSSGIKITFCSMRAPGNVGSLTATVRYIINGGTSNLKESSIKVGPRVVESTGLIINIFSESILF